MRQVRASGAGTATGSTAYAPEAPGKIVVGEPVIAGALDRAAVDAAVNRNVKQLLYCCQRVQRTLPDLEGEVTVTIDIGTYGVVQSAKTKATSLNNPTVEDCLNGRIVRFQFPAPAGSSVVRVTYPFRLSPS